MRGPGIDQILQVLSDHPEGLTVVQEARILWPEESEMACRTYLAAYLQPKLRTLVRSGRAVQVGTALSKAHQPSNVYKAVVR